MTDVISHNQGIVLDNSNGFGNNRSVWAEVMFRLSLKWKSEAVATGSCTEWRGGGWRLKAIVKNPTVISCMRAVDNLRHVAQD